MKKFNIIITIFILLVSFGILVSPSISDAYYVSNFGSYYPSLNMGYNSPNLSYGSFSTPSYGSSYYGVNNNNYPYRSRDYGYNNYNNYSSYGYGYNNYNPYSSYGTGYNTYNNYNQYNYFYNNNTSYYGNGYGSQNNYNSGHNSSCDEYYCDYE